MPRTPATCWVSRLCFEPVMAARWFEQLLRPAQRRGNLRLLRLSRPVAAVCRAGELESLTIERRPWGQYDTVRASVFIDATDAGDLLMLSGMPYRIGKEARHEFDEPDAPLHADPQDQQPVTWVMALRKSPHPGPLSKEPAAYHWWRDRQVPGHAHALFSPQLPGHKPGSSHSLPLWSDDDSDALDWWRYRRIVSARQWQDGRADVSLVNWAQNDYAVDPLIDGPRRRADVEAKARELTLCLLHWLHTEAPRPGAGFGFPEWQPAPDILGTGDGLAARPYLRESRRMVTMQTLTQRELQHLAHDAQNSVTVGWYPLDIHPTCRSGHGVNAAVEPFTIPLGSFVSAHIGNLLPGSKNLGVTHLANACTRVHPVEWSIGEVAGVLATHLLQHRVELQDLLEKSPLRQALMRRLDEAGVLRTWPDELLRRRAGSADSVSVQG